MLIITTNGISYYKTEYYTIDSNITSYPSTFVISDQAATNAFFYTIYNQIIDSTHIKTSKNTNWSGAALGERVYFR